MATEETDGGFGLNTSDASELPPSGDVLKARSSSAPHKVADELAAEHPAAMSEQLKLRNVSHSPRPIAGSVAVMTDLRYSVFARANLMCGHCCRALSKAFARSPTLFSKSFCSLLSQTNT